MAAVVVADVSPRQGEGDVDGDPVAFGEDAFGLLDRDPGV